MDDTRARFLTAIAGRLGADRIVELHLFSPIRQGVVETGVAVVAVTPGDEQARAQWGAEAQARWGEGAQAQWGEGAQAQCGAEAQAQWGAGAQAQCGAEAQAQWGAGAQAQCGAEAQAQCGAGAQAQCGAEAEAECSKEEAEDAESPYAPTPTVPVDPTVPVHPTVPMPVHPTVPMHPTVPVHPTAPVPADRLVVFTARYHLTRKGPDRGKWLFECGATADAPLATVDAVARGVTQRSKDLTETERLSGDQLRTLLQDPAWRMPA